LNKISLRTKCGLCLESRCASFGSFALANWFQEAYKIFTIDKLIGSLIKQVRKLYALGSQAR
jgi:histone deacetylase complex regulatory component SIN3